MRKSMQLRLLRQQETKPTSNLPGRKRSLKSKTLKIKLTPLNIVSALCLVFGVWILMDKQAIAIQSGLPVKGILVSFSLLAALVAFISDLIFRKIIPSLGRLWAVQLVLISFVIILIIIIKVSL